MGNGWAHNINAANVAFNNRTLMIVEAKRRVFGLFCNGSSGLSLAIDCGPDSAYLSIDASTIPKINWRQAYEKDNSDTIEVPEIYESLFSMYPLFLYQIKKGNPFCGNLRMRWYFNYRSQIESFTADVTRMELWSIP